MARRFSARCASAPYAPSRACWSTPRRGFGRAGDRGRLAPGSSGDTAGTGRFGSSASGPSASAGGAAAGAGATAGCGAAATAAAACFCRCARRTCSRSAIRSSWDTPRRQSAVSRRRV